jgi:hypothetical protein
MRSTMWSSPPNDESSPASPEVMVNSCSRVTWRSRGSAVAGSRWPARSSSTVWSKPVSLPSPRVRPTSAETNQQRHRLDLLGQRAAGRHRAADKRICHLRLWDPARVAAGASLAAWHGSWPWFLILALTLVFTPLLFPTGRLLPPRWRPAAWLAAVATAVLTVLSALRVTLGTVADQVIVNPIGVAAVGHPEESPAVPQLIILLLVLAAVAFGSLVLRFRRSRGAERQQLKWFTYAGVLLPLAVVGDSLPAPVGDLLFAVPIVFLPVAAGIAILRHRLYEIDRLINRPWSTAGHRPAR